MYKRYQDGFTDFIETRPGLRVLHDYGSRINGIYFLEIPQLLMVVHAGTSLYRSIGVDGTPQVIYSGVLDVYSTAFVHEKSLYFLDGEHYLKYDGTTCAAVTDIPHDIHRQNAGGRRHDLPERQHAHEQAQEQLPGRRREQRVSS